MPGHTVLANRRPLKLKALMERHQVFQTVMAEELGLSRSALSALLNHGVWPVKVEQQTLRARIKQLMQQAGADRRHIEAMFTKEGTGRSVRDLPRDEAPGAPTPRASGSPPESASSMKEIHMLMRKQGLSPDARRAFGLFANPFDGEVQSEEQMFINAEVRYVRESMLQAALNAGMLAVIGESGAGKTTIVLDLKERIERDRRQVIMIEPAIIAMADNDRQGRMLKASDIADAIIYTLNPVATPRLRMEGKKRQIEQMLVDSARTGNQHVILIEEAHSLPVQTLRHLKRFNEIRDGRKKLLGVLLVGQPELEAKLNENFAAVREVVQRTEVVKLQPLGADLKAYLAHRLKAAGKTVTDLLTEDGVEAMRMRLQVQRVGSKQPDSMVYPLAINNLVTACLNLAASLGFDKVDADVVKGV